jgi:signal transduction histidine kinase
VRGTGWPAMAADSSRLRPVRWRTTLVAVGVVGATLVVTGTALAIVLRHTLTEQVREDAELRAQEIAAGWRSDSSPLAVGDAEDQLVQVVDADGRVVASSPNVAGEPLVAMLDDGESAVVDGASGSGDFLAVAAGSDGRTVIVARSLDDVDETTWTLVFALGVGIPSVLLVVGATTWLLAGPVLSRAERADRRQRQFVSDASHELRSPVAAIRQHAEVALAHPDRTAVDDLASPVLADAIRVQALVEDMLLLARMDEDALRLERRPVDLDDLVLDEVRRLRAITRLTVDGTGITAARVDGDPRMLARVVRNLGDNAARHAHTIVALGVRANADTVELCVDDDGPGVPPADRGRVLERFVRLDAARERDQGGGTGLGLAIVAEVVAAHGGSVSVSEAPLGGARFRLVLPAG